MSLSRIALRIATVKALAGRTFAGDRVRDSEIGPIEDTVGDETSPVIVVYTDDEEAKTSRRNLASHDGVQSLVIEIAVTTRMKNSYEWSIPTTDAGMEMTIDIIGRQIVFALQDPSSEWGEMWRRLALDIGAIKSQRGTSVRDGVRFAGRQIVIDVALVAEPQPWCALPAFWEEFFSLAESEPDLAPVVPLLRAAATGEGATDWRSVRAAYGMTADQARALAIAPDAASAAAPAIDEVVQSTVVVGPGHDSEVTT